MLKIKGPREEREPRILTAPALAFVEGLVERFSSRLVGLLQTRREKQAHLDAGGSLDFLAETAHVRDGDWRVAQAPPALDRRRVEITGPTDPKTVINALNSGADVFMADFEDATSPTWENLLEGQRSLFQAVRRSLTFVQPDTGKTYALADNVATLMVRPRGLHLPESHALWSGRPIPGCLFDFGLFLFHNAQELLNRGAGPYFYVPKLQSHLEARWWNDVFVHAEDTLALPRGSIRATVLIETLPAAFEMDEILFELKEHSAGLNCGRWDYIFSAIKTRRGDPSFVLPDRSQVTMEQPFLRAYTQLLVKTCHRRGAHAMGGMSAFIPIRDNASANATALEKVRADKEREARDGHDGTWVAHPGLVSLAREIFDAHLKGPNQLGVTRDDVHVEAADLLEPPRGTRTEATLRHNVRVGILYLEAWLSGKGCVPIDNLMEDAATAEICRSQVWQWLHHGATLDGGEALTADRFETVLDEEREDLVGYVGAARHDAGRFAEASALFEQLVLAQTCADFLTIPAYEMLLAPASIPG